MIKRAFLSMIAVLILAILAGGSALFISWHHQKARFDIADEQGPRPRLGKSRTGLIPLVRIAKPIGWRAGTAPTPAPGLTVQRFATGLVHPRWLLVLPNGDVLVAETNAPAKRDDQGGLKGWITKKMREGAGAGGASANRVTLLRDTNGDGIADQRSVLLSGLNSPFGMALAGKRLYVADTDALLRFPFSPGQTRITVRAQKMIDLPAGPINHFWTRNVIATPDGSRLYVAVGGNSNAGENGQGVEQGRAAIWEINPATGDHRIYAYGLRNPVGLDWEPKTHALWTVVNERDGLGSDIVPDYLTSVQFGGFYGWPWFYWGSYPDHRAKDPPPELIEETAITPDYSLGPHTAPLGLAFAAGTRIGAHYGDGAFISLHGSWNRDPLVGYKVVFAKFAKGQPIGKPVDVLTAFLDDKEQARGRPVGLAIAKDGALLIADDVGNTIWRVAAR